MLRMLAPVVVGASALLFSAYAGDPVSPIIVDVVGTSRPELRIAGRHMTDAEFGSWMKDTALKFGDTDPVVVRVAHGGNFLTAGKLAVLATETHKSVFIAIDDPDSQDGSLFLIPISRDQATFTLPSPLSSTVPRSPATAPRLFEAPRNPAAEQWNRLQKINNRELP